MLNTEDSLEFSQSVPPLILPVVVEEAVLVSEAGVTPLILPAVEELINDTPAAELVEMKTTRPESGSRLLRGFLHLSGWKTMGGWTWMTCEHGSVETVH